MYKEKIGPRASRGSPGALPTHTAQNKKHPKTNGPSLRWTGTQVRNFRPDADIKGRERHRSFPMDKTGDPIRDRSRF